jgi:osmotically-inducible protein OsmY
LNDININRDVASSGFGRSLFHLKGWQWRAGGHHIFLPDPWFLLLIILQLKTLFLMADYNRNRSGNYYSHEDRNEPNRYGHESEHDDQNDSYTNRSGGSWNNRSSYNRGREYDDRGSYGGSYDRSDNRRRDYGDHNSGSYNSNEYGYPNYNSGGSTYGGYDDERKRNYGSSSYGVNFGSSRYDRRRQSYSPGGYQNYGGGNGYGGSYLGGGYGGGSDYGQNFGGGLGSGYGSSNYSSNYGYGDEMGSSQYGNYGDRYRDRGSYYGNMGGNRYQREGNQGQERSWWDKTTDEVSSWFGDEEAERRRRMDKDSHKGRGPRNYQRSDARIQEDINDRLSDDWFVDASDIEVSVLNGEVVLTGTVNERSAKRRAEDIADAVSGVKNVENRIRVLKENSGSTRSYEDTGSTSSSITGTSSSSEKSRSKSSLITDSDKS